MDENPLLAYLGIRLTDWKPGLAELQFDVEPRHLNRQGALQGGVTATFLDAACGYAGLLREGESEAGNAVTVMLTVSYLAAARTGHLKALGTLTKAGRSLFFRYSGAHR
jgi:uncharacterized protein (TIGR00369 family)